MSCWPARDVDVPYRTLHRFAVANAGYGRKGATVRLADREPGMEVQVDFGKMGLIPDPVSGRRRVVHALIFTACYSCHNFVFLTYRQKRTPRRSLPCGNRVVP
ncbi:MAG: hypothetical protein ACRDZ5_00695 [Acidimicrobiales bacterium]